MGKTGNTIPIVPKIRQRQPKVIQMIFMGIQRVGLSVNIFFLLYFLL
ncbi:hypothetical protein HMPREF3182_00469 [Megasphaera hutchinsoni]|uniref:Uncharacterized protein n=1 Tax=Megasphaera hutchinsoni TaxID=1588748 RepID=A0A134CJF4_9FIRM|nr:hypothetical protein HMPREF3182_00469 [Megasphaera hutchinsoni]